MKRSFFLLLAIGVGWATTVATGEDRRVGKPLSTIAPKQATLKTPQNFLKLSEKIYCGAQPKNAKAYAWLANLGIKTIVSVDGLRPRVEAAQTHGLRYVHIPIGYDDIDQNAGQSIARLVRDADGPVYIHCHHGLHRGPAAAAIACIADGGLSPKDALKVLERAGTSQDYPGLWHAVATYQVPPSDAELPELVEVASTDAFASSMASIDRAFDKLKTHQSSDWIKKPELAEPNARQLAILLREGLRESGRSSHDDFDPQIRTWLEEAEALAERLTVALEDKDKPVATKLITELRNACQRCHQKYRN